MDLTTCNILKWKERVVIVFIAFTWYGASLYWLHCCVRKLVKGNWDVNVVQGWVLHMLYCFFEGSSFVHFIFVPMELLVKQCFSLEDTPPSHDLEQVDHLDHSNHTASSCTLWLSTISCFFFFFFVFFYIDGEVHFPSGKIKEGKRNINYSVIWVYLLIDNSLQYHLE